MRCFINASWNLTGYCPFIPFWGSLGFLIAWFIREKEFWGKVTWRCYLQIILLGIRFYALFLNETRNSNFLLFLKLGFTSYIDGFLEKKYKYFGSKTYSFLIRVFFVASLLLWCSAQRYGALITGLCSNGWREWNI